VLDKLADLLEERAEEFARVESTNTGKPLKFSSAFDVPLSIDNLRYFASAARNLEGKASGEYLEGYTSTIRREPLGVCASIAPWNYPLNMACWKIGPALAAGNAVVLKPSEITPFSVVRMAQLAIEAGIPPGIFNIVQGDGRTTGTALCQHRLVGKITFTGSTASGAQIMSACALHGPKPVTLELGGKSPQLVFDDADVERTAATLVRAITTNAGQVCVAGSRLIAHKRIAPALVERIIRAFQQLRPGPTWDDQATLGPIASQAQLARMADIVQRARYAGAELLYGGRVTGDSGYYYLPTLLSNVDAANPAVREEIFGPVLTLQTFEDEEEGLALAAHDAYGLAAGVHTADLNRALRAMRRIDAGTVWINRFGRTSDFVLPTGGWGRSGFGKDLGRHAVEANLRHKSVLMDFSAA
jgi:aldehyde dehydrogenase (NAD+)